MKVFVPVAGTFATHDDPTDQWWFGGSAWQRFINQYDCRAVDPDDPYSWSTDLSGYAWAAAGLALIWYVTAKMEKFDGQPLRVITHSYGINCVAEAAAHGLKIDTLITVTPPYRATMQPQYDALRANTTRWLTIHAKELDEMVILGGLFDGEFNTYPPKFAADYLDQMPGIGHSGVFNNPGLYELWAQNGWIDLLTSETWGSRIPANAEFDIPRRPTSYTRRSADKFNARLIK